MNWIILAVIVFVFFALLIRDDLKRATEIDDEMMEL
jgi:preprotein translocase subunit YajC